MRQRQAPDDERVSGNLKGPAIARDVARETAKMGYNVLDMANSLGGSEHRSRAIRRFDIRPHQSVPRGPHRSAGTEIPAGIILPEKATKARGFSGAGRLRLSRRKRRHSPRHVGDATCWKKHELRWESAMRGTIVSAISKTPTKLFVGSPNGSTTTTEIDLIQR